MKKLLFLPFALLALAGCTSQTEETKNEEVTPASITATDVEQAQESWGENIVAIGEAGLESQEAAKFQAKDTLNTLYAFDKGPVLFKPTKASEIPFRSTKDKALSYFVGGDISEDDGFALQPWTNVRFENYDTIINGDTALASGIYYFTSGETNEEVAVEYTFGYVLDEDNNLRIHLHHSSLPFS